MGSKGGDAASDSSTSSKKSAKKPAYSKFTQQELPAFKPILTPLWIILAFTSMGIVFIPIGIASLHASNNVVEIAYRYDQECVPQSQHKDMVSFIQSASTNKSCATTLTVTKKMKSPVFVYYQLDNFYQNHRRYVKSRNDDQLKSAKNVDKTTKCEPEDKTSSGAPIVPCGMVAWSLFNDTYKFSVNDKSLPVSKKGIAWESDVQHKFGADVYPKNFQSRGLVGGAKLNPKIPLKEQEDLIVWMRPAALPNFRKLYGKIESDLEANQKISVAISNNYNTYSFGGEKKVVLSTASWIGGKNDALAVTYLVVGGTCLLLALFFMVMFFLSPRALGDPSYLSWNKHPGEFSS